MNRGDVVIADLKPHEPTAKVRPVLVVQNKEIVIEPDKQEARRKLP